MTDLMTVSPAVAEQPGTPKPKVGDILYSSWGYDQTNIDFYQVLKVTASSVVIQQIAADATYDGHSMTGKKVAIKDTFIGKPLRRKINPSTWNGYSVRVESYAYASPWDGKPKDYSCYA